MFSDRGGSAVPLALSKFERYLMRDYKAFARPTRKRSRPCRARFEEVRDLLVMSGFASGLTRIPRRPFAAGPLNRMIGFSLAKDNGFD